MKTVTVKISEELDQKLTAIAEKSGESKSDLIRTALDYILSSRDTITPNSCLDLAMDLCGSIEGPTDLSYNKKHLEGYGQ
jgi:hypothetical protein